MNESNEVNPRHECPAKGCEGGFEVDVVDGERGGGMVKTTCDHAVGWCAYCERVMLVDEMVYYSRGDYATDAPTPKVRFCPTCAAAGKVEEVPGWSA